MSRRLTTILTIFFLALSAFMGFLYWQTQKENDQLLAENARMTARIEAAEQEQREAIIQRRISEQLENITREQKNLTEEQTRFAIEQRTIAEERQAEAINQRQKADIATARAVKALDDAENQRQIAVEQKDIAESERLKSEAAEKRADRLRQLALSQALSIQASNQQEAGNEELAAMLSTMGWKYAAQNSGDPYQSDLFSALKKASGESTELRAHTDYIRALTAFEINGAPMVVSASQNGEIRLWRKTGDAFKADSLVQNDSYDFREIVANQTGDFIAAGDMNGNVLIIEDPAGQAKVSPFELTNVPITGLHFLDDDRFIYTDGNGIVGLIILKDGYPSSYLYQHERAIRAISQGQSASELIMIDDEGQIFALDLESNKAKTLFKVDIAAASLVQNDKGMIAVGARDGRIILFNRNSGESSELIGHQSMVNDLVFAGEVLVSVSYDQTVRLWNLSNPNSESILLNQLGQWGYALCLMPGGQQVASAGADRVVRIDTIDPEALANMVNQKINRDFSPEEWQQFIGEGNPFQKLIGKE